MQKLCIAIVISLVLTNCHCKDCPNVTRQNTTVIQKIYNAEALAEQVSCFRNYPLKKLTLKQVKIDALPRDLFDKTNIRTLIIKDSSIKSLVPNGNGKGSVFQGLKEHLKRLIVLKPDKGSFNWQWNELSELKNLEKISIGNEAFKESYLNEQFVNMGLKSLKWLQLTGVCLESLREEAFSKFPSLESITLQGNELDVIHRTYFPSPALHLKYLDLSYNRLGVLPSNLFDNMPVIEVIDLSGNSFQRIHKMTDSLPNLRKLFIYNNKISCDWSIAWLIESDEPESGVPFYENGINPLQCIWPISKNSSRIFDLTIDDLHTMSYLAPIKNFSGQNYLPMEKC